MSDEAKTVTLSFGRNSIGQYQASINDEDGGFRIAGGKYDGRGTVLLEKELSARDAEQIRHYLDAAFPPAALSRAADPWTPIADIPEEWTSGKTVEDNPPILIGRVGSDYVTRVRYHPDFPTHPWWNGSDGMAADWPTHAHPLPLPPQEKDPHHDRP